MLRQSLSMVTSFLAGTGAGLFCRLVYESSLVYCSNLPARQSRLRYGISLTRSTRSPDCRQRRDHHDSHCHHHHDYCCRRETHERVRPRTSLCFDLRSLPKIDNSNRSTLFRSVCRCKHGSDLPVLIRTLAEKGIDKTNIFHISFKSI